MLDWCRLWRGAAVLAGMSMVSLAAQAPADPTALRVQILSGRTGRPLAHQHLTLLGKDGKPFNGVSKAGETTDGEGYALLPGADVTIAEVVVNVDLHKPCSKTWKHEFSMMSVRTKGVVSENSCKPRITLFPQQGTLVFFVREETWLEKLRR